MSNRLVTCRECGESLDNDTQQKEGLPCHKCGSTTRNVLVTLADSVKAYESIGTKRKDPTRRSEDKLRVQTFDGFEYSHSLSRMVEKERIIDRDSNRYYERVLDSITRGVIHYCDEELKKHQGHGYAKKREEP
jgi:hypothetical protein